MGRHPGRRLGSGAIALLLAVGLASAAAGAARPDGHDRALAHALAAKVSTFAAIATATGENALIKSELKACPPFGTKDPGKAFAAAFALLPPLLVRLVDDFKPQLVDLVHTVSTMHPDAPLFRQWLTALGRSYSQILELDNHGQKVDLCKATMVILNKASTAADYRRALGIDPTLVAMIFGSTAGATVSKLDPKMRAFFVASGVSAKSAKRLTS